MWDGGHLWLSSLTRSQRWIDTQRDSRLAVVIDAGEQYQQLRGVEIIGRAEPIGEVPRLSTHCAEVADVERVFGRTYMPGGVFTTDGRHAWLRIAPTKIVSSDFRKLRTAG